MVLSAVAFAAALVACLVFAPLSSAASDPVATGSTTTITLNSGLSKKLKKSGVKVKSVAPASVKGKTVTLPIESIGSNLDPTTGQGTLIHEGGIKFKKGKKTANVTALELVTSEGALKAKVAGKAMKFASVSGVSSARNGFGANVTIGKIKLTSKAAKQLNKKLGFSAKKKAKKSTASASKKKKAKAPFKANQVFGKASSTTQPKEATIIAGGTVDLATNATTVKKFVQPPISEDPEAGGGNLVKITPIPPTTVAAGPSPYEPILKFPVAGGTIAPNAGAGTVNSAGGVDLIQDVGSEPGEARTTIRLGNLSVDLATKKAIAEVVVTSNIDPALNLGSFGRTSIADINMTGATITSDPATHTVTVQNAAATLQETTATVLNEVFGAPWKAKGFPHPKFNAGDPLGTFSFSVKTQ